MKRIENYLEHRRIGPGAIALDNLPKGRGLIVASQERGIVSGAWEYESITAALTAWLAWDPMRDAEPQGYAKRRNVETKVKVVIYG